MYTHRDTCVCVLYTRGGGDVVFSVLVFMHLYMYPPPHMSYEEEEGAMWCSVYLYSCIYTCCVLMYTGGEYLYVYTQTQTYTHTHTHTHAQGVSIGGGWVCYWDDVQQAKYYYHPGI